LDVFTSLAALAQLGFTRAVDDLLKAGTDVRARGHQSRTAVGAAWAAGQQEVLELLLTHCYTASTGLLDWRDLGLDDSMGDRLSLPLACRSCRILDLRSNPQLTRIPNFISFLDPRVIQEIRVTDSFANDEENQVAQRRPAALIVAAIRGRQHPTPLDLQPLFDRNAQRLDLRNQQLDDEQARRLPFHQPRWWQLRSLDLRGNPALTSIPSCLGFLDRNIIREIRLDIHNLMPSLRPFANSATSIVEYARGLLTGNLIKLNQVKLMVVGRAAVGKTSLIRSLYGRAFDPTIISTDGIHLGEFTKDGIRFVTWDFGGQKVYRYTHQLFLANNALYLVLFKLTDPLESTLTELRFWVHSIMARTREAKVLIIGTHLDKAQQETRLDIDDHCRALATQLSSEFPQLFSAGISEIFKISCASGGEGTIKMLRRIIRQAAESVNVEAPENYRIAQTFFMQLQTMPPLIGYTEACRELQTKLPTATEAGLTAILDVLDNCGVSAATLAEWRRHCLATTVAGQLTGHHRDHQAPTGQQ
jgi:GTPase SAR1 family protein